MISSMMSSIVARPVHATGGVGNDGDVDALLLHLGQQLFKRLRLGHGQVRPRQRAQIRLAARHVGEDQVLDMQHAERSRRIAAR